MVTKQVELCETVFSRAREMKQNRTSQEAKGIKGTMAKVVRESEEAVSKALQRAIESGIDATKRLWEFNDDELNRMFEYTRKEELSFVLPLTCALPNIEFLLTMFHCDRCGRCCQGSITVPILSYEVKKIAGYLGVSHKAIKKKLIYENGQKFLPKPCPFYDDGCSIQRVKPNACATFPIVDPVIVDGVALIGVSTFCDASIRLCRAVARLMRSKAIKARGGETNEFDNNKRLSVRD